MATVVIICADMVTANTVAIFDKFVDQFVDMLQPAARRTRRRMDCTDRPASSGTIANSR